MPKKKQSTQTELFAYVKTAKYRFTKVPIQYGEQQQKKNGKKNLKLVFHLSVSLTTIHVIKLIPCLSSKRSQTNEKWRLPCHLTTDNSNLAKHTSYLLSSQDKTKVSKRH